MTNPPHETDAEERQRVQNERWNLPEINEYRELVLDNIIKGWENRPSPILHETDHRRVLSMMRAEMDSRAQLVRHQALAQGKSMCGIKMIIWLVGDNLWHSIVDENSQLPMDPPENVQPYDVEYRQMYLRAESDGLAEVKELEIQAEQMNAATAQELSGAPTTTPRHEQEDLATGWHIMLGKEKRLPWSGPFTIAVPREMFEGPAGVIDQPQQLNTAVKLFARERPIEHGDDFWIIGVTFSDANAANAANAADSLDVNMYRDIMIAFDGLLVWGIRHVAWARVGGRENLRVSVTERCERFRDSYDRDLMAAWVSQHLAHFNRSMGLEFGPEAVRRL